MFYFIFGLNNSGTTVVSQYLETQTGAYLPPYGNHEGQHVPAVRHIFRHKPWKKNKVIDWDFVRRAWEAEMRAEGKTAFIDASPPNIAQVAQIRRAFGAEHRGMLLVNDPYAQIASCLKTYTKPPMTPENIYRYSRRWSFKIRHQQRNRQTFPDLPVVTYEAFCADPAVVNRAFGVARQEGEVAVGGKVNQHLQAIQAQVTEIRDLSVRTLAFLRADEVEAITQNLHDAAPEAADLVTLFGYELLDGRTFEARLASNPAQADEGRDTRKRWEALAP